MYQDATFSIKEKLLILCEGPHDRAFLRALLKKYHISGFQTTDPTDLGEQRGGHTFWLKSLNRIVVTPKAETVRGIIVMGDNDLKPADRLSSIVTAISSCDAFPANGTKLPVPTQAEQIVEGAPSVMILMVPLGGKKGNLEKLCLPPARRAAPENVLQCVDQFKSCAGWSETRNSKAEIRALISCIHKKDPELAFSRVWEECPSLIPLEDNDFVPLVDLLKEFKATSNS